VRGASGPAIGVFVSKKRPPLDTAYAVTILSLMNNATTTFTAAKTDLTTALNNADASALRLFWDRTQVALENLPLLHRCDAAQRIERERLLGERAALLEARPTLINR
jgi:hypothetical protein